MSTILRKAIIRKVVNLGKKVRVIFWEKRGKKGVKEGKIKIEGLSKKVIR
jgi:hypothetical protein